jgi:hypothetical protein
MDGARDFYGHASRAIKQGRRWLTDAGEVDGAFRGLAGTRCVRMVPANATPDTQTVQESVRVDAAFMLG